MPVQVTACLCLEANLSHMSKDMSRGGRRQNIMTCGAQGSLVCWVSQSISPGPVMFQYAAVAASARAARVLPSLAAGTRSYFGGSFEETQQFSDIIEQRVEHCVYRSNGCCTGSQWQRAHGYRPNKSWSFIIDSNFSRWDSTIAARTSSS